MTQERVNTSWMQQSWAHFTCTTGWRYSLKHVQSKNLVVWLSHAENDLIFKNANHISPNTHIMKSKIKK